MRFVVFYSLRWGGQMDFGCRAECAGLFKELLENCEKFSKREIDSEVALDSLEKVLKFNYEHNSLAHFNRAFALKKKSKSGTGR